MSLGEEDWKASQRCEELPLRSHQCRHRATVARRHHPPLRQNTIVFVDKSWACFHYCPRHTRTSLCSFHPFPTKKQVKVLITGLSALNYILRPTPPFHQAQNSWKNNYWVIPNPTIDKNNKATPEDWHRTWKWWFGRWSSSSRAVFSGS